MFSFGPFLLLKNRCFEQNLLRKNFASTKTIGGGYTATAVELRNGRGQVGMIFCIFSGPLRPSPARAGKMFSDPAAGNSGEKPGMGPERAGEGPEKVLRKMCVFEPFGLSFLFILAFWAFVSFHFGLLGLRFLSFWPFGPSFPFILAFWGFISSFWALISFHFGLFGLHFLSFWLFGASFPFILAFWAFISFHFGLFNQKFEVEFRV